MFSIADGKWKATQLSLRQIPEKLDAAIAARNVVTAAQYKLYWQRYMFWHTFRARRQGKAQVLKAGQAGHTGFADLKAEVEQYFSAAKLRYPVSSGKTNEEYAVEIRALRKAAWRAVTRPKLEKGQKRRRAGEGGTSAYQSLPRF